MTTTTAQVVKNFHDGTVDILTLPVATARAHVSSRTHGSEVASMVVRIGRDTHRWTYGQGWVSTTTCDFPDVEHPGFPCGHPVHTVS